MSLIATEKSSTIELIPEGVHIAKCVSIIDLGTQTIVFEKKEKEVHQARFEFELPNLVYTYKDKETEEEVETTKLIGANFTVSLNGKAKLKKFLESWKGKKFTAEELQSFDLSKVLGKTCQLQIIHSEDGQYANIENALPLMQGMAVPKGMRELTTFSIDEKNGEYIYNIDVFNKLPEWIQEKILSCKELNKSIEEQETEIQKKIREAKPATKEDAEDVFSDDEASGKAFTNEPKKVEDNPFGE